MEPLDPKTFKDSEKTEAQRVVHLIKDVSMLIDQKLLQKEEPSKSPSFLVMLEVLGDEERHLLYNFNQVSNNWNYIMHAPNKLPQHPLLILQNKRDNRSIPKEHALVLVDQKKSFFMRLISSAYTTHCQNNFFFDGPNEDTIVLVSKTSNSQRDYSMSSHLFNFSDPNLQCMRGESFEQSNASILGHQAHSIALASKKLYAIASNVRNASRDWLHWYTYDKNFHVQLLHKKALPESLQKIAFLINSTLIGLTKNGSLVLYWLDKNHEIKQAQQKTPFKVVDFAVDPINKGLVALAFQKIKIEIAMADIFHRDSSGRILYQYIDHTQALERDVPSRQFTLYDSMLWFTGTPNHKRPYSLLQLFARTKFKKALCGQ